VNGGECCAEITGGPVSDTAPRVKSLRPSPVAQLRAEFVVEWKFVIQLALSDMKPLLRYINQMPFRFTIRHYFPLSEQAPSFAGIQLDTPEAWDAVRKSHPHFSTPETRNAWIASLKERRDGQDSNTSYRAKDIAKIVREGHFTSMHSLGVGSAALEYYILQEVPELDMAVSEYNEESVRRLQKVFPEAHPKLFDIMTSPWSTVPEKHLVLIYRLDPHLTDAEWRQAFQRMYDSGVQDVLFIPSKFLTIKNLFLEWRMIARAIIHGHRLSFAGYKRTQKAYEYSWAGLYSGPVVDIGRLKGYLLTRLPVLAPASNSLAQQRLRAAATP
jgi:hypothetical protein